MSIYVRTCIPCSQDKVAWCGMSHLACWHLDSEIMKQQYAKSSSYISDSSKYHYLAYVAGNSRVLQCKWLLRKDQQWDQLRIASSLWGWRLHNISRQPAPMLGCPPGKKAFSSIQLHLFFSFFFFSTYVYCPLTTMWVFNVRFSNSTLLPLI